MIWCLILYIVVASTHDVSGKNGTDNEYLVLRAKLAEQAERYEDARDAMKKVTETGAELTNDERHLLAKAYHNDYAPRRHSWRIITDIEQKSEGSEKSQTMAREYREKIEKEMKDICNECLSLLDKYLIPKSANESKVFYLKMRADYYRYLSEFANGDERTTIVQSTQKAYQEAFALAEEKMRPTDPVRLGLALNFSLFYFEFKNSPDLASILAKKAFDDAIAELDTLDEEHYKESTKVMQLIRDNLTLWATGKMRDREGDREDVFDIQ